MGWFKNNSLGQSLPEVLIAAGMVGAIALAATTITQQASRTSNAAQVNISWQLKRMMVEDSLQTINGCENSLVSDPDGGAPYAFGDSVQRIRSKSSNAGGTIILTSGASYPQGVTNPEFKIVSMTMIDKSGGVYGPNTLGAVRILVQWEKDMAGKGKGTQTNVDINIEVATTGAAVPITGCRGRDNTFTASDACVDLFGGTLVDISGSGDYRCLNIQGYQGTATPLTTNTAIGNSALMNLLASSDATAFGDSALKNLTVAASGNTAIGVNALTTTASGISNTAIGSGAMSAYNGSDNTAIGLNALAGTGAASGTKNIAIGNNSQVNNSTGTDNISVGFEALNANTTGTENIAIGTGALKQKTTSSYNTAVGVEALNGDPWHGNTAIGYQAGKNQTSSWNIMIGMQANGGATTDTSNSIAIGNQALMVDQAWDNIAIGEWSMNKTNGASASANVAVGSWSMQNNTDGTENVSIGYNSMSQNTTGSGNVAIGMDSLFNNTTGINSVAVGYYSMFNTTATSETVAVGANSLYSNTTGGGNTAIGQGTLYRNTTGNWNTAVGDAALFNNTTNFGSTAVGGLALATADNAGQNTAMGYLSMMDTTTGEYNSAYGASSLENNTTGTSNVAVGYQSMYNNVSGGENVGVGLGSLFNNNSSWNTGIGHNTISNITAGANSNTALGAYAMAGPSTGFANAALGVNVLRWGTAAGTGNTFIGTESGALSNGGSYNVAVGYQGLMGAALWSGSYNTCIGALCQSAIAGGGNWLEIRAGASSLDKLIQGNAGLPVNQLWLHGNVDVIYNGVWANVEAGSWTTSSDKRFKHDIRPYESGLKDILKMKIRYYKRNKPKNTNKKKLEEKDLRRFEIDNIGVIAQEVQKSMPDAVHTGGDGMLAVDQNHIFFASVRAIQEQQLQIEENKKTFDLMKNGIEETLENHESRISKIEKENSELKALNHNMQRELASLKEIMSKFLNKK